MIILKKHSILLLFFFSILFFSCDEDNIHFTEPIIDLPDEANSVSIVINDMQNSHEGIPHGVPTSYDWQSSPVIHHALPPEGFNAITNWGQFYEEKHGNPSTNTRVQIRNLKTYYLSISSGNWEQLQAECPYIDGKWFPENFQGSPIQSDNQDEEEGISATAGYGESEGYCYHFWKRDRAEIIKGDIAGIFTTLEARLIVANPDLPDDRKEARYVINVGADYWTSLTYGTCQGGDVGMGRFKYVRTGWRSYNFITLNKNEVLNNPPPLN